MARVRSIKSWLLALVFLGCGGATAQQQNLSTSTCNSGSANPPACTAVRGDRADGWMAQGRSEVMGRNGIVATSQPLATEAGLDILRKGGNAVDAAVAAAAVLNLLEPMNVGIAGDLFAIIYTARDKKLHVLNASGMAPGGATIAFMNSKGYRADPANWGPGSGMPARGILTVTVPGTVWGGAEPLKRHGTRSFKEELTMRPPSRFTMADWPRWRSLPMAAIIRVS